MAGAHIPSLGDTHENTPSGPCLLWVSPARDLLPALSTCVIAVDYQLWAPPTDTPRQISRGAWGLSSFFRHQQIESRNTFHYRQIGKPSLSRPQALFHKCTTLEAAWAPRPPPGGKILVPPLVVALIVKAGCLVTTSCQPVSQTVYNHRPRRGREAQLTSCGWEGADKARQTRCGRARPPTGSPNGRGLMSTL